MTAWIIALQAKFAALKAKALANDNITIAGIFIFVTLMALAFARCSPA